MNNLPTPIYAALAAFVPRATIHDIDPNRCACREENRMQMQARAMREAAAQAEAMKAIDRLESPQHPTYGALELMRRQAGSFAAAIAHAYSLADATNQQKLSESFGDLFARYSANAAMLGL